MFVSRFSQGTDPIGHVTLPAEVQEGFDPHTGTETILEGSLMGMHKEEFWDSIERQKTKKLLIACNNGETVAYEKGFLKRLLVTKPGLADLTESYTLEFPGGEEVKETRARLLMCGDTFGIILNGNTDEQNTHKIAMRMVPLEGFQAILKAVEIEEFYFGEYSDEFKEIAGFLQFSPAAPPDCLHGQNDYNLYWGEVGNVPPPPERLLKAMKAPCPISNEEKKLDGPRMIDTHIFTWITTSINEAPLTVNNIEMISKSNKFGDRKIGYEDLGEHQYLTNAIRNAEEVNRPIEAGYWLARYRKPILGSKLFEEQKEVMAEKFPGYKFPSTRELIVSIFMDYVCSGDEREKSLDHAQPDDACILSRCEEKIGDNIIQLGGLSAAGLRLVHGRKISRSRRAGVCPVQIF